MRHLLLYNPLKDLDLNFDDDDDDFQLDTAGAVSYSEHLSIDLF